MSYICSHSVYDGGYTPYVDVMFATLSGAGWELHDDISSTSKVYKSKGESGDYCYAYLHAALVATSNLELCIYQDWNSSTHVGLAGTYYYSADTRVIMNSQKPVLMYCNKDFLLIWSTQAYPGDNHVTIAGMLSGVFDTTLTTTTASGIAGSSVSMSVVSSTGFFVGAKYKVIGVAQEGREVVTIESITDTTHIVVANLVGNYDPGTYIGKEPCPIFQMRSSNGPSFYIATGYSTYVTANGTAAQTSSNASYRTKEIIERTMLNPDPSYTLYGLCPAQYEEYNVYTPVGWLDNIYNYPVVPSSSTEYDGIYMNGDLYLVRNQALSTVSSGTTTTTTFTAVSWAVNEMQDKYVVIAVGNPAGHTRKIISNTSDTITVGVAWDITPANGDTAAVCDEVYRPIYSMVVKEDI